MTESSSLGHMLLKVGLFGVVQVLVYLILTKSSTIFSKDKMKRSLSFRPARSVSIRRFLAAIQDMPSGGEPSPSSNSASSPSSNSASFPSLSPSTATLQD